MKLCLGTAQFGMKYGVNNQIGRRPTLDECFNMLDYAIDHGIDTLDTASVYGEAECILGDYFRISPLRRKQVKLVSKLRPITSENFKDEVDIVRYEFENSIKRLNTDHLDGYLLHAASDVYKKDIVSELARLREERLVDHIGLSIYETEEGFAALDTGILDSIQMPYSILDQRGIKEGLIKKAKKNNYIVAVRSVFLQGLLQMKEEKIPKQLKKILPYIHTIKKILLKYEIMDPSEACLGFVKAEGNINYLVFGVDTIEQLQDNIDKYNKALMPEQCVQELKRQIEDVDASLIFPFCWNEPSRKR